MPTNEPTPLSACPFCHEKALMLDQMTVDVGVGEMHGPEQWHCEACQSYWTGPYSFTRPTPAPASTEAGSAEPSGPEGSVVLQAAIESEICPDCEGSGKRTRQDRTTYTCGNCQGSGKIQAYYIVEPTPSAPEPRQEQREGAGGVDLNQVRIEAVARYVMTDLVTMHEDARAEAQRFVEARTWAAHPAPSQDVREALAKVRRIQESDPGLGCWSPDELELERGNHKPCGQCGACKLDELLTELDALTTPAPASSETGPLTREQVESFRDWLRRKTRANHQDQRVTGESLCDAALASPSDSRLSKLERVAEAARTAVSDIWAGAPAHKEPHVCGPESNCDGFCVEVSNIAESIRALDKALAALSQPAKGE